MANVVLMLLLSTIPLVLCGSPFSVPFRKHKAVYMKPSSGQVDPGQPLYLTPLIMQGQVDKAKQMSAVSGVLRLKSYSGFFTVSEAHNSNMFFWFFPAQNANTSSPLLLWLQGGPGGSSLFGLFNENGPIVVDKNGDVSRRAVHWNKDYHMLYIDNPVGTGFSFTVNKDGFSANETAVAENLYSCLTQFFTVFSEYQSSDFYITGESYAGKYIPAIGYKIHTENQNSPKVKINMKGAAIGDGFCDPENMLGGYGDLLFQFGMADENQKMYIDNQSDTAIQSIKSGNFIDALKIFDSLLNGDLIPYPTYFYNISGSTNHFNILRQEGPPEFDYYPMYINQTTVRSAIHVGSVPYGTQTEDVDKALVQDIMDTVKDMLVPLMENYKILLYNGQLDIIVGGPLTERFLQVLDWSGKADYLKADRKVWRIGDDVAGYVRAVGNFSQVIVRGGGHLLPHDQPERTLNMIDLFVSGKISKYASN